MFAKDKVRSYKILNKCSHRPSAVVLHVNQSQERLLSHFSEASTILAYNYVFLCASWLLHVFVHMLRN